MQVRREYDIRTLDADRAGRFAAAALLNVLPPSDWQVSSDVELVVGKYVQAIRDRIGTGTALVEVAVHRAYVELVIDVEDPNWIEERVRLRPRRPFAASFTCNLPDRSVPPLPRPALWPGLAASQNESTWLEWNETWEALHEITQSIRHGQGDLTTTLDAVAAGVVKATLFTVAAVNLVLPGGDFQVVSVEGSPEARQTLLGVVESAAHWDELMARGTPWGSLRYVPHDVLRSSNSVVTSWAASDEAPDDPDLWNPLDALIAPLYTLENTCLGALSVDLPIGARRPGAADLARLEVFADHAATAIERALTGRSW